MKARIKVVSFDTSMWGGMNPTNRRETAYLVETGDSIHTLGLDVPHEFKIVDVRPKSVDILVHPEVRFSSSDKYSTVGLLTLEVSETIDLQMISFDAWGNWVVTLEGIV